MKIEIFFTSDKIFKILQEQKKCLLKFLKDTKATDIVNLLNTLVDASEKKLQLNIGYNYNLLYLVLFLKRYGPGE